jgi:hypothetical protein
LKGKLVEFPESILEALAEYKKTTGTSANEYIRNATCRRMIIDGIIKIKQTTVEVGQKGNGKKIKEIIEKAPTGVTFCDGDKCEIDHKNAKK